MDWRELGTRIGVEYRFAAKRAGRPDELSRTAAWARILRIWRLLDMDVDGRFDGLRAERFREWAYVEIQDAYDHKGDDGPTLGALREAFHLAARVAC